MDVILEKGGGTFQGIRLQLCENPLPPLDEAIAAAKAQVHLSNLYTEAYSAPLRRLISTKLGVAERHIHINAGSELILRQLFDLYGQQVHLLTPTYPLFPEIAEAFTETTLLPGNNFNYDLSKLVIPEHTTLVAIVNPNNPNGGIFDMSPLPRLLRKHPKTKFLIDEAFIGLAGQSVANLVPKYTNLLVTRTLSKAHSLAGLRIGYAVLPEHIADDMNFHNDAYPLSRPSEMAAIVSLRHEEKIHERAERLRSWAKELSKQLEGLGVRTFPSETYFFLADFAPYDAHILAEGLRQQNILIRPLNDHKLGSGYMRVTTALPEENARFIEVLKSLMSNQLSEERSL
jgi:histidinol-phosphate aminotransferase